MRTATTSEKDFHAELVRSYIRPLVVTDRSGLIVEWNRAAERCIGLPRERAIGSPVWEVQATVAPATIPYEKACAAGRNAFRRMVQQSDSVDHPWRIHADERILAADGTLRHVQTETFPLWIDEELVIVSTMYDADHPCGAETAEYSSEEDLPAQKRG